MNIRIFIKTLNPDYRTELFKAIKVDQENNNTFEGFTMQGIVGLRSIHRIYTNLKNISGSKSPGLKGLITKTTNENRGNTKSGPLIPISLLS